MGWHICYNDLLRLIVPAVINAETVFWGARIPTSFDVPSRVQPLRLPVENEFVAAARGVTDTVFNHFIAQ